MMNGGARRPAEPEGRAASPHAAAKRKNQFERNAEMTKKKLMMMVVAVAVAFGERVATETVDGYTWTYQINGDTAY